jgi:hypothetical protein
MINENSLLGWALLLALPVGLAVPFWITWTVCGIGDSYFFFLPAVWRSPGFGACVGIFIAVSTVRAVCLPKIGG